MPLGDKTLQVELIISMDSSPIVSNSQSIFLNEVIHSKLVIYLWYIIFNPQVWKWKCLVISFMSVVSCNLWHVWVMLIEVHGFEWYWKHTEIWNVSPCLFYSQIEYHVYILKNIKWRGDWNAYMYNENGFGPTLGNSKGRMENLD